MWNPFAEYSGSGAVFALNTDAAALPRCKLSQLPLRMSGLTTAMEFNPAPG